MITRTLATLACLIPLAACTSTAAVPATEPTRTVPLTIQVPVDCSEATAQFSPVLIAVGDYERTLEPSDKCQPEGSNSTLTFAAPLPADGAVQMNPGNQPAATFNADAVTTDVSIVYQESGSGFAVASVSPPLN